jgi:hypothetical protein
MELTANTTRKSGRGQFRGVTNEDRVLELRRQRDFLRGREFRTSIQARRDILAVIVPLLNFNDTYYGNAMPAADILGRPGLSSNLYEHAFAQVDSLVGQAVNELELAITPTAQAGGLVSTPGLTDEHGVLWFWHHCSWRVRWWLIAKAFVTAAVIMGAGFALGRINFFVEVWKLWKRQ